MKQYCDYDCDQCTYETCIRNRPGKPEVFKDGGRICRQCGKWHHFRDHYKRFMRGRFHLSAICKFCEIENQLVYNRRNKLIIQEYRRKANMEKFKISNQINEQEEACYGSKISEGVR